MSCAHGALVEERVMTEREQEQAGSQPGVADDQPPAARSPRPAPETRIGATVGYLVTIAVNVVLLYVANHLLDWQVSFITPKFEAALWAINLSLGANVLGNAILMFYDARPFKHAMQVILNVPAFLSVMVLYTIFPFAEEPQGLAGSLRIALVVAMVGIGIGTLAELVQVFTDHKR